MRIYLPLSLADLSGSDPLVEREVFGATSSLRAMVPDEDDEGAEYIAFLAAADAAIELAESSRIVVAADAPAQESEVPGLLRAPEVSWEQVVSIHIDDPAGSRLPADIAAAAAGDEAARERVNQEDLLWYDATERAEVISLLTSLALQ